MNLLNLFKRIVFGALVWQKVMALTFRPLWQRSDALAVEHQLASKFDFIIGSDESGSGCIAGPIVVASCCIRDLATYRPIPGVDDCKRLNADERQRIYRQVIDRPELYVWSIETRSSKQIDASSAQKATSQALVSSVETVVCRLPPGSRCYSIVDGHKSPSLMIPSRPWKQADTTVYTVALASILARVVREQLMEVAAAQYPEYEFDKHCGYSTQQHIRALHQHGPCPIHRISCQPVKERLGVTRAAFLTALMLPFLVSVEPSAAVTLDRRTGIAFPDPGEIEASVPKDWSVVDNPFEGDARTLFSRLDSSNDSNFYTEPRFVEHVDDPAVRLMTDYISHVAITPDTERVLDLCSSWTSHISVDRRLQVAGLGLNAKELQANPVLTDWVVQDLNERPVLPYQDNVFDCAVCQLSIDYLTRPLEVCKEIARVLKVGGSVHILFSNRLFLSKAVAIWTGADDVDHAFTVASYLYFCNGGFTKIEAKDLSVRKGRDNQVVGDPLYVVAAVKG